MKEDQSLNPPKTKPGSDSDLRVIYSCKEHAFSGLRRKRTVINPPQNLMVPDAGRCERVSIDLNRRDPRSIAGETGANRQNLASTSFTTTPKRSVLRFHRSSQPSFLKKAEDVGATQVPKDNFQQALLNRDGAKTFPKSVRKEVFESKNQRKFWKKKMVAENKSCLIKNAYKTVVLRKRSRLASEKLAIWIQLKATDVVRKYVCKCHGVVPRRHLSKTVLLRMQLRKKKIVARKIKEAKRAAEALALSRAPSSPPVLPAGAEEQLSTPAAPAEQPARLSNAGGVKRYRKTYFRRRKKLLPVREYDLRSLSSTPNTDRMVTRLASKSKSNEAK